MIDSGKHNVLGIGVNAIDYEAAVQQIIAAGKSRQSMSVTALAVHGIMTGVGDREHRYRLNQFDLVCPDGPTGTVGTQFAASMWLDRSCLWPQSDAVSLPSSG